MKQKLFILILILIYVNLFQLLINNCLSIMISIKTTLKIFKSKVYLLYISKDMTQ
jgi:hypothetical protein